MSGMEWRRAGGPAGGRAGGGRGGERRPQRGEDRRPRGEDRRPPRRKRASSLPISEISVGDAFSGVVSEMGRHGAFITVTDGSGRSRDGLLRRPQREYREGDRVSVSVAAVNAEKEQIDLREAGGAEGAPARRAEMNPDAASFVPGAAAADPPSSAPAQGERKLLILDLNGVLGARVPYHMRSHSSSKFQKRPHCDAFLRFCFDNFDVAVWSCAAREKMELFLFTEEQRAALRFVFHQKHSRNLWPRFSSVSSQKPLFLKDLAHSLPSHDLSRVLLLDNHAEKFEGNPLGSCLAVPEYAFAPGGASRDDVLSPQGELTARLSALRDADSAAYMASNPCAFFPTSHPAPQPLPCGPPPPPVLLKDVGDCFCGLKALRESRLFRDVRADKFVSRSVEVPQPRASSLRRRDLGELLREPYVAAEKTDGTRAALVVHPAGFAVLLQRNLQAEVHPDGPRLAQLLCANKMGLSVLDGELVQATLAGEAGARRVFLCFDAVVLSGREVATTPSLLQRLKGVRDAIGGDAVVEGMALPLLLKRFHAAGEVGALLACLSPSGGLPGMLTYADGERSSDCDGLILTPSRRQYFLSNSYKFKPHELITIDLKVQPQHARRELQRLRSGEARELRVLATTFRKGSKEDVDLLGVLMDEATAEAIASHRGRGAVVECAFDSAGARGWHALRLRHDKARPNSLGTCWRALESIAERLTAEEIASHLKDNVGAVASHYDARQRERNERGRPDADNPIFQLRKLNNFVKALLLNKCAELLEGDGDRGAGGALTGADPLPPERCGAVPEALRGTGGGPRRDRARAARPKPRASVCELAVGRGGDLGKYGRSFKVDGLLGTDISETALEEASRRARSMDLGAAILRADMAQPLAAWDTSAALSGKDRLEKMLRRGFDLVVMQFALHYSFARGAEAVAATLGNVRDLLRSKRSLALVTVIDAEELRRRTRRALGEKDGLLEAIDGGADVDGAAGDFFSAEERVGFGNAVYGVRFAPRTALRVARGDSEAGLSYAFTLGDAVVDLEEAVVPTQLLAEAAAASGLRVIREENFASLVQRSLDGAAAQGKLLQDMKVAGPRAARALSQDEWDVASLYKAVLLERAP